jgi:hypothetical protein
MIIDNNNDASSKTRNPWRLCLVNQVEEVKLVLCLIPIGFSCLMFNVVQVQLHTYFIKQGSTMLRSIRPHFQLPPASLQAFTGINLNHSPTLRENFRLERQKIHQTPIEHYCAAKDRSRPISLHNQHGCGPCGSSGRSQKGQHCQR